MRWPCAAVALVGCGRLGFDEREPADVAPPTPPSVVANAGASNDETDAVLDVEVPPTTAGDTLLVSFSIHTDAAVVGITDDANNTYVSTGVRAVLASTASEIWRSDHAGSATRLQITMDKAGSFDAYTLEVAGIHGAPAKTNRACLQYPPAFVSAPITTTVPDELIVTVTMFAFPVFVSAMLPPFVGLPPQSGNATGYLIAHEPGTYASTFTLDSGEGMVAMTCASSVSWTP